LIGFEDHLVSMMSLCFLIYAFTMLVLMPTPLVSIEVSSNMKSQQLNRKTQDAMAPSPAGSATLAPTITTKCYVCGSEDSFVTTPDVNITIITGRTALCGSLEWAGRTGRIPVAGCAISTTAATAACNCEINSTGTMPVLSPVSAPLEPSAPVVTTVDSPVDGSDDTPVLSPVAIGDNPVCYICGSNMSFVSNPKGSLLSLGLVQLPNVEANCGSYEQAGRDFMLINAALCTIATNLAKSICGCSDKTAAPASPPAVESPTMGVEQPMMAPATEPTAEVAVPSESTNATNVAAPSPTPPASASTFLSTEYMSAAVVAYAILFLL
jgi:hypothetical protein